MMKPEEIMTTIDEWSNVQLEENYQPLMLEIMCNIAITLNKIQKEISDEG